MKNSITQYIDDIDIDMILPERRVILDQLANAIKEKRVLGKPININFICTHNSRRSIMSQVWCQTIADYFDLDDLQAFSGGTESTAIALPVIDTLKSLGFKLEKVDGSSNPINYISYSSRNDPIKAFSKTIDALDNPQHDFIAVMTCSEADQACPSVVGAAIRIALPYDDPKVYDGSKDMMDKYAERSNQIATEIKYVLTHSLSSAV